MKYMAKTGYFSNVFIVINNAILKNKFLRNIKVLFYYIDGIILSFIKKPKKEYNKKQKVFIVYNLSLGDGAMFNCALKNIREIYPKDKYDILLAPIGIEECSTNILISRAVCAEQKVGIINYGRNVTCSKKIYQKIYNKIIEVNNKEMHLIDHYFEFFNKLGNINKSPEFVDLPSDDIEKKHLKIIL